MKATFAPARRAAGTVAVPGDKSLSHRALLFGALASGSSEVRGLATNEDVGHHRAMLEVLGARMEVLDGSLHIQGCGVGGLAGSDVRLDAGNSGTAARLVLGAIAGSNASGVLDGDESLRERPMARVVEPLRRFGARLESGEGGRLPVRFAPAARLVGTTFTLELPSAQVRTALLLAGLAAEGETVVSSPPGYRDHTERMLAALGADVRRDGDTVRVSQSSLSPFTFHVPGDLSSASFLLGAAALGGAVTATNVTLNPSRTGFLDALELMGAAVRREVLREELDEPTGDVHVHATGRLRGAEIGGELAQRALDELPLLGVLAAAAEGTTVVRDAPDLRAKESDRIAATVAAVRGLGGSADERPDGFVVHGGELAGGHVGANRDHRIAMAAAVASFAATGPITIDGFEWVATSYPEFTAHVAAIGGRVERLA